MYEIFGITMKKTLNITNGDSAVEIMQQAGISGEFLPWRDVLHDGPVPNGLSLDELSELRAKFICDRGWGSLENITASFIERDNTLKSFTDYEKVILWFEHDLYDQLQIIQILDWFNQSKSDSNKLSIICVDQYLGMMSPEEMAGLPKYEEPVTEKHLELSSTAWSAFRSKSPEKWHALLETDTSVLPFLQGAIIRQLEEYPNCSYGLSRTAHQALKIISEGESNPWKVFAKSQEYEARMFMGDSSFWVILQELLEPSAPELKTSTPLLKLAEGVQWTMPPKPDQELSITPMGEAVLAGEKNWLELAEIACWIGGVHLTPKNMWCWESGSKSIVRRVKL